jgi:hypothetical protein
MSDMKRFALGMAVGAILVLTYVVARHSWVIAALCDGARRMLRVALVRVEECTP